nr:O-antigen ligase family protein [Vibrio crassostreae]
MVIFVVGLGYPRNDTGFSGFLNHPQAFGIFLSVYISIEAFFYKKLDVNFNVTQLFFVSISVVMLIMTESRTGFFSLFISLPLLLELNPRRIFSSKKSILILMLAIVLLVVFSNSVISIIDNIVSKSGRSSGDLIESLEQSRLYLAQASMCDFNNSPLWGTGFQISTGVCGLKPMQVEYAFGLPISAPVEKGVFFSALIGESGLLGVLGFIIIIGYLVFICIRNNNYSATGVISLCLLTNLGESTLFSLGGIGGLIWASIVLVTFYKNDVVD